MVCLDITLDRFYAAVARTAFKGDGQQSLHHFWYAWFLSVTLKDPISLFNDCKDESNAWILL
jgi:hypothetical protein